MRVIVFGSRIWIDYVRIGARLAQLPGSLIIPITAFMAKETAAMVCKAMSDSLKERISKVTVSDSDSLRRGILTEMHVEGDWL